jgi:hypothetical protein
MSEVPCHLHPRTEGKLVSAGQLASQAEAEHKPRTINMLAALENIFVKNSPKLACQAPHGRKNRQTPYKHWRIIFPKVGPIAFPDC